MIGRTLDLTGYIKILKMDEALDKELIQILAYYGFPITLLQTNWSIIKYFEDNKVLYVSTSILLFEDDDPGFTLTIVQNNNVIFQQNPYSSSQAAYKAAIEYIINNLNTIIDEHKQKQIESNNN